MSYMFTSMHSGILGCHELVWFIQTTIYKATHKTKDIVTWIPRLPVDFSLRVFWRKRTVYLKIFWSFSIETEKNIILHDLIYL
jgi:hypothetical protein